MWVFDGAKLYQKSVVESVYEVRLDGASMPKRMEMTPRESGVPRDFFSPELAIYKFVGEKFVIATSRVQGKHPLSFTPTGPEDESNVVNFVLTLERIEKAGKIPEKMLKRFGDDLPPRTKNRDAEEALFQFMASLLKRETLADLNPRVANGQAEALLKVMANRPAIPRNELDRALLRMTARDVVIGERLLYNGEELVIQKQHFGPDKILLVMQDRGIDQECFWLYRKGGRWKVDVTGLIAQKQATDLGLFGGIVLGMKKELVWERLERYRRVHPLKSYSLTKNTDSQLIVDWKEENVIVSHLWTFTDGKLSGYTTKVSKKQ